MEDRVESGVGQTEKSWGSQWTRIQRGESLVDVLAGLRWSRRRVKEVAKRENMTVPSSLFPRDWNEVRVCIARAEYKRRSPVARSGQRLLRGEKLGSLGLTAYSSGSGNGTRR